MTTAPDCYWCLIRALSLWPYQLTKQNGWCRFLKLHACLREKKSVSVTTTNETLFLNLIP